MEMNQPYRDNPWAAAAKAQTEAERCLVLVRLFAILIGVIVIFAIVIMHLHYEVLQGQYVRLEHQFNVLKNSLDVKVWYVDAGNVSGCASDKNNCTSSVCGKAGNAVGPCSTVKEINRRLNKGTDIVVTSPNPELWP